MASKGKSKTVKRYNTVKVTASKVVFKDVGIYINPLTDFGFKRIFGTEANKDLLIDFLNTVLHLEDGINVGADLCVCPIYKTGSQKNRPESCVRPTLYHP